MCEMCQDLIVEIHDPLHKSNKKYDAAIGAIEKALGYSTASGASEISPYKSVRQLGDKVKDVVEKNLLSLHSEIATRWLGLQKASTAFKLDGKIFLNPKTGKPLTKAQWAIIKKDLMRSFSYVYGSQEKLLAETAVSLGKIIAKSSVSNAIGVSLGAAKPGSAIRIVAADPAYRAAMQFAAQFAGELIVDLTQTSFKRIHDRIVVGQINRISSRELERDLFYSFGEMNRDWRRIAETEIANNVNNGQLITELEKPLIEGEYRFMQGMSSPMACPWCASEVNERVVVLLEEPPTGSGDKIEVDDKGYTAIWPGKNNVGRPRVDWWIAAGTQHPHCQCSWIRYTPGYEKLHDMLSDAIAAASKEQKEKGILPQ